MAQLFPDPVFLLSQLIFNWSADAEEIQSSICNYCHCYSHKVEKMLSNQFCVQQLGVLYHCYKMRDATHLSLQTTNNITLLLTNQVNDYSTYTIH